MKKHYQNGTPVLMHMFSSTSTKDHNLAQKMISPAEIIMSRVMRKTFSNRSDTNWFLPSPEMASSLKFCIAKEEYNPRSESKALISFAVTAKLICDFVFA